MSSDPHSRSFNFYQLEDRVLLSADGFDDASDLAANTELIDQLLEQALAAEGNQSDSGASLDQNSDDIPTAEIAQTSTDEPNVRLELIVIDAEVQDAQNPDRTTPDRHGFAHAVDGD